MGAILPDRSNENWELKDEPEIKKATLMTSLSYQLDEEII
jgi:hypothetical protein